MVRTTQHEEVLVSYTTHFNAGPTPHRGIWWVRVRGRPAGRGRAFFMWGIHFTAHCRFSHRLLKIQILSTGVDSVFTAVLHVGYSCA